MALSPREIAALLQACLGWATLPMDQVHFSLVPELVSELTASILSPDLSAASPMRQMSGTDGKELAALGYYQSNFTEFHPGVGLSWEGTEDSGPISVADGQELAEGAAALGMFLDYFSTMAKRSGSPDVLSGPLQSMGGDPTEEETATSLEEVAASTLVDMGDRCLRALESLPLDQRLRLVDAYAKLFSFKCGRGFGNPPVGSMQRGNGMNLDQDPSHLHQPDLYLDPSPPGRPEGNLEVLHGRWRDAALRISEEVFIAEGSALKRNPRMTVSAAVLAMRMGARRESLVPLLTAWIRPPPRIAIASVSESVAASGSSPKGSDLPALTLEVPELALLTSELMDYMHHHQAAAAPAHSNLPRSRSDSDLDLTSSPRSDPDMTIRSSASSHDSSKELLAPSDSLPGCPASGCLPLSVLLDQLLGHFEEKTVSPDQALALAKASLGLSLSGVSNLKGWGLEEETHDKLRKVIRAACERLMGAIASADLWRSDKGDGRSGGPLLPRPGPLSVMSSSPNPDVDRMIEVKGAIE